MLPKNVALLLALPCLLAAAPASAGAPAASPLDGIALTTIDGKAAHLGDAAYRGHPLLIVNTASKCGFTSQYADLVRLQDKYRAQGLVVLGFPSNDFGGQEPGTHEEIKAFCSNKYKVDFPLFAKAPVSGAGIQPLFKALVASAPTHQPVAWNFEKFLLDRRHAVAARYLSPVSPESPEVVTAVEMALRPN